MTTVSNLTTVQHVYESFGKGDIPAILEYLREDIAWEHHGNPSIVPFAGTFRGKDAIMQFFQQLGQNAQFPVFRPQNFRENGNQVINDVYMEGVALPTGKDFKDTPTFTWTFDDEGKVIHWKNEGGMESLEAAYQ